MGLFLDGNGKKEKEVFDFFKNLVFTNPYYMTYDFDYGLPEETPVYNSDFNNYKSFCINVSDELFERVMDYIFNEDDFKIVDLGHKKGYVFYDDIY